MKYLNIDIQPIFILKKLKIGDKSNTKNAYMIKRFPHIKPIKNIE